MILPRLAPALCLFSLTASASAQDVSFLSVDDAPDGDGPVDLAYTLDGQSLLVLHQQSDDLTFVDPDTGTVETVVPVGSDPRDLALTPDGRLAVTADLLSGTLTVVDIATREVSATIPLTPERPYQVEITNDSRLAVVGLAGQQPIDGAVSMVDLQTFTEVHSFPTPSQEDYWLFLPAQGQREIGVELEFFPRFDLTPDDSLLLLPTGGSLYVYDIASGDEIAAFSGLQAVLAVRAAEDGRSAVCVGEFPGFHNEIWRLDLESLQISYVTDVPIVFYGDALEFLGPDIVAIGSWDGLHVIDLVTRSVSTSLALGGYVFDFELTRDGEYLVATSSPDVAGVTTMTTVVELATESVVSTLPAGGRRLARDPGSDRAAALEMRLEERLHRLEIDGAASELAGSGPTGAPIEGDAPARAAVAEEAGILVTANTVSRNVSVVDIRTGGVERWIPTTGRPLDIIVTPDGAQAVASTTVGLELLDLAAGTVTDLVPALEEHILLVSRPAGAEVWTVSEDAISGHRIADDQLQLITTHPIPGPPSHGFDSSSNGRIAISLVQDGLHNRLLIVYDTVARSELGLLELRAPRIEFGAAGSALYIQDGDDLLELGLDSTPPEITRSMAYPGWINLAAGSYGRYLYVNVQAADEIQVLDLATWTIVGAITQDDAWSIDTSGPYLFAREGDAWRRYLAAGPSSELVDEIALDSLPNEPIFSERAGAIFDPKPGKEDSVLVLDYTGEVPTYCTLAQPNSTGAAARISVDGWLRAREPMTLFARNVPTNQTGYFLVSRSQGFVPFPGNSQGILCLSGPLGRFRNQVQNSGTEGTLEILAQTSGLPQPGGTVSAQAGETWHFQAWFRDLNPGPTSNFSDAVSVTFR